jgi:predicted transcriptional regulator/DNA-binding XRE family transcriptional regulator
MRTILGARIRERRRSLGITQAELARRVGISASYLNLIEHNKRSIAGALLRRTADALEVELETLDGAAERRLLQMLEELAHAPDVEALGVEREKAGELLGRFPGWARTLAALARSERDASDTARVLADRLTHDPFLGEAVHKMLTEIAAVRSAAEILVEYDDIEPERRRRFLEIIHAQSHALTEVGEALASYFDKAETTEKVLTPLDEVEAMLDARDNRFEELETAVAEFAQRSDHPLLLQADAPRMVSARALVESELSELVDDIVARQPQIETSAARGRARETLLGYAAGAMMTPMSSFAPRAAELGYDIEALADALGVSIELVCYRLTALPADDTHPRFGYIVANAAGTIIDTRSLHALVTPRYASACPLWVLYRAQQAPQSVIRQRTLFPSGERFIFLARARQSGPGGFGKPRHYLTDMLVLTEADAERTVYAPDSGVPVEPVGTACRSCPRRDCQHRVADPMIG